MIEDTSASIEIRNGEVKCVFDAKFIVETNGMYSWYIPAFNMFYSSRTREEGIVTGRAMSKSFFSYWLEKEKDFRSLILEINKLGFKAPDHRITVNKLLSGKTSRAKFQSNQNVQNEFANSEKQEMELEMI